VNVTTAKRRSSVETKKSRRFAWPQFSFWTLCEANYRIPEETQASSTACQGNRISRRVWKPKMLGSRITSYGSVLPRRADSIYRTAAAGTENLSAASAQRSARADEKAQAKPSLAAGLAKHEGLDS
jgi:hypothetical protein